ncbi:response regulator [Microbacterium sp. NPDC056234]|uniref:response regulator n=1 Tax=Microbacterium sp. NPDC056234 TaxID=3345757 RepID=UPI0035DB2026
MIRVLIADDQEAVRTGLRLLLETIPDIEVIGEAVDGLSAVQAARRLRPDVALVDIRMPGMDGIQVTEMLAGRGIEDPIAVVIITTFDLDEYVHGALRAGAKGFLLKDAGGALIGEAIRAAAAGDSLVSPRVTTRLLSAFATRRPTTAPSEPLTPREEEVLSLLSAGLTNAEIGERLFVSMGTVKAHIGAILLKLGVRNRVEAAMWAYDTGRAQS